MTSFIHSEIEGATLRVRLNRPEKKNAINGAMYRELSKQIDRLESDREIRVMLILGLPGIFSAGNDIRDFLSSAQADLEYPVVEFLMAISSASKPVVAAVDGLAIGIGVTMLLHCDLVYVSDTAVFQLPFVQMGLVPEAGSSLLLPRLAGYQKAFELLVLGRTFNAETAVALGMANELIASSILEKTAHEKANQLAALPPASVMTTKQLLKSEHDQIKRQMDRELERFREMLSAETAQAAISDFLNVQSTD